MPRWSPISHRLWKSSPSKFSHMRTFEFGLLPPGQIGSGKAVAPRATQPPIKSVAASSAPLAIATSRLLDLIATILSVSNYGGSVGNGDVRRQRIHKRSNGANGGRTEERFDG